MTAGICAAWPFRKEWLPAADVVQSSTALAKPAPLLVRPVEPTKLTPDRAAESSPAATLSKPYSGPMPLTTALERELPRRALVKVDEPARLPALAADYVQRPGSGILDPRSAVLGNGGSSPTIAEAPPPPGNLRRYRIRKHDTLDAIAERMLGSRQHADKLLAANPEVILVPEILPVGATIVIPDLSHPSQTVVRVPEMGH